MILFIAICQVTVSQWMTMLKSNNCSLILLTFHCGSAKELLENGTFKFSIRFKAPEIHIKHI